MTDKYEELVHYCADGRYHRLPFFIDQNPDLMLDARAGYLLHAAEIIELHCQDKDSSVGQLLEIVGSLLAGQLEQDGIILDDSFAGSLEIERINTRIVLGGRSLEIPTTAVFDLLYNWNGLGDTTGGDH